MARIRPLAHAPISEALIDLRVEASEGLTVERLDKSLENRDFGYSKKGPILRGYFGVRINAEHAPPAPELMPSSAAFIGTRLHSRDEKCIVQFTTEGFTLSRLEPYESWEALIEEAQRVWREYMEIARPVRVHRVATRFINNLRLPLRVGDRFERFLTGLPQMPHDYPQSISSFLQRFVIYDEGCGATAIVTQALQQFSPEPPVPVILDIDVFREHRFAPDRPEVWDYLAQLRTLKNKLFFGALTEDAVSLYE